jgi:hypothetical protein
VVPVSFFSAHCANHNVRMTALPTNLNSLPTTIPFAKPLAPRPSQALIAMLEDGLKNIVRNAGPVANSLAKFPAGDLSTNDRFQLTRLQQNAGTGAMYMSAAEPTRVRLDKELGAVHAPSAIRSELVFLSANATRMGAVSGYIDAVNGFGEIRSNRDLAGQARFARTVDESATRALAAMRELGWR